MEDWLCWSELVQLHRRDRRDNEEQPQEQADEPAGDTKWCGVVSTAGCPRSKRLEDAS